MKSSNPALKAEYLERSADFSDSSQCMTLQGTINKCIFLISITIGVAGYLYHKFINAPDLSAMTPIMIGGAILGFIVALVIIFKPKLAGTLAPLYAALQGALVGSVTVLYATAYEGLVAQAILYTFLTLFGMLILYKLRIIQATKRVKSIVITGAVVLISVRVLAMIMSMFGSSSLSSTIHGSGMMGIGFSVVAVCLAAFFLILDFDLIETGVKQQAPKHMEWYGGFALLVTLVWLYLEMLRLLSKLQRRN